MSVRRGFPSRLASSYSCITARVDITAAASGETEPTCDLAATAPADGSSKVNMNFSRVIIIVFINLLLEPFLSGVHDLRR